MEVGDDVIVLSEVGSLLKFGIVELVAESKVVESSDVVNNPFEVDSMLEGKDMLEDDVKLTSEDEASLSAIVVCLAELSLVSDDETLVLVLEDETLVLVIESTTVGTSDSNEELMSEEDPVLLSPVLVGLVVGYKEEDRTRLVELSDSIDNKLLGKRELV